MARDPCSVLDFKNVNGLGFHGLVRRDGLGLFICQDKIYTKKRIFLPKLKNKMTFWDYNNGLVKEP